MRWSPWLLGRRVAAARPDVDPRRSGRLVHDVLGTAGMRNRAGACAVGTRCTTRSVPHHGIDTAALRLRPRPDASWALSAHPTFTGMRRDPRATVRLCPVRFDSTHASGARNRSQGWATPSNFGCIGLVAHSVSRLVQYDTRRIPAARQKRWSDLPLALALIQEAIAPSTQSTTTAR